MTQLVLALLILSGGLIAVTILDTVGAYASRRLHFSYGYLAILSFSVYILIGFLVSRMIGLQMALLVNIILAFYDAVVGLKLSKKLKANFGLTDAQMKAVTISSSLTVMLPISIITTLIGYALS